MITINNKQYKELRCAKCQKFIVYQNVSAGILCIQCPRCDFLNEWTFRYLKNEENDAMIKRDYEVSNLVRGVMKMTNEKLTRLTELNAKGNLTPEEIEEREKLLKEQKAELEKPVK